MYGFGQHDNEFVGLIANDGSGDSLAQTNVSTGQLETYFVEDQYKATSWLTLIGGLRLTHFGGSISENAADPRLRRCHRHPHLRWTLRGFWGTYYQAPPLSTASGPLLAYAVQQGLGFIPLRGERDQETSIRLNRSATWLVVRREQLPSTRAQLFRPQQHWRF